MNIAYSKTCQVFTDKQEDELQKYILTEIKIYFGLSPNGIRILLLQCAKRFLIKIPHSWKENGYAFSNWFAVFNNRHLNLYICAPEPKNWLEIQISTSLNAVPIVTKFREVSDRSKFYMWTEQKLVQQLFINLKSRWRRLWTSDNSPNDPHKTYPNFDE